MSSPTKRPAAVLWTGGKDSAMALAEVADRLDVRALVTFVPEPARPFLAHPLPLVRAQAEACGLPHRALPVGEPYAQGYERALATLAADGIEVVVTGDIDEVDGHDSWIVARAAGIVDVERPLWKTPRAPLMRRFVHEGWRVICTLAKPTCGEIPLVGRVLDDAIVESLIEREADATVAPRFDAAGENGEYHTAVLDGPCFRRAVVLRDASVTQAEGFQHLVFDGVVLD